MAHLTFVHHFTLIRLSHALLFYSCFYWSCLASAAHAQDLLTKRNGEEIAVKVVEITPCRSAVPPHRQPRRPAHQHLGSDVFMIRYANGAKEVLNAATGAPPASRHHARAAPGRAGLLIPRDCPRPRDQMHPTMLFWVNPFSLDGPRLGFTVLTAGCSTRPTKACPASAPS